MAIFLRLNQALGFSPFQQCAAELRGTLLPASRGFDIQMRGCRLAGRGMTHQRLMHTGEHQAVEQRFQFIGKALTVTERMRVILRHVECLGDQ